jgi:hypothetical protein
LTALAFTAAAHATQVAPVGDASVSTARPSTNFGTLSNLYVGNGNTALLQFDLTTLPTGLTSVQIAHAATSAWSESSVTSSTAPSPGASAGMFTVSTAGQYVTLDVTSLVQGWVTTPATNFGFALSSGTANLLLDSKENDETAHPASLDITITSTGATGPQGRRAAGPHWTHGPYRSCRRERLHRRHWTHRSRRCGWIHRIHRPCRHHRRRDELVLLHHLPGRASRLLRGLLQQRLQLRCARYQH